MEQIKHIIKALKLISAVGIPLKKFVWPNIAVTILELISLYLLARLMGNVLSAAAGSPIDITATLALAALLVLKSFANALLMRVMYSGYAQTESKIRAAFLDLARAVPSRSLRAQSVETVTHQISTHAPNLTYGVYQQFVKLLSDLMVSAAILAALIVTNPRLTAIIVILFGIIAFFVGSWTITNSARAGRIVEVSSVRLVNLIGRYLGSRNEIAGSALEPFFQSEVAKTNDQLSRAHAAIMYSAMVPRFAFDAVVGVAIFFIVAAVTLNVARLDQQDLAFSLAAAFKLAPYITSIIASLSQISFSRPIILGYRQATEALTVEGWGDVSSPPKVAVAHENGTTHLTVTVGGSVCSVVSGEILVIKGKSGSGKTTIAELIADVIEGRVGSERTKVKAAWAGHLAFCSQFPAVLDAPLSVNVLQKETADPDDEDFVMRYDLSHLSSAASLNENTLSGGERQRIGIVRTINQARDIVIFDEPTSAIGKLYGEKIREDIQKAAGRGSIVVVVTHDSIFDPIADALLEIR